MRRALAILASAAALAACTATTSVMPTPTASVPTSASATPSATTPTRSPLSGRRGGVGTPVIVVKVDNTPAAQPHHGLPSADVVYLEPVEWGLTRIAAVFSTKVPDVVGPVRSARIGDLSMLAPYGNVAFVFSGAQKKLWPILRRADLTLFSEDLDSPGFFRESDRVSPVNLMAHPIEMLASAGDVAVSHDMGLVFDRQRPEGGGTARVVTAQWPYSSAQFRWNARAGAYDVWLNGRQARDVDPPGVERATTVVIQYVKEVDSGFGDKFGGRTPLPVQVGSGYGLVLRDGASYPVRWRRPSTQVPPAYARTDGGPLPFDPGQVWVVLMDRTRPVTVR